MSDAKTREVEPEVAGDCLIAEKVMGWRRVTGSVDAWNDPQTVWNLYTGTSTGITRVLVGRPFQYPIDKKWDHQFYDWKPRVDIAAAWEVVEAMRAKGYDPEIRWNSFMQKWVVSFNKPGVKHDACADTMPTAVCAAALAAEKEAGK